VTTTEVRVPDEARTPSDEISLRELYLTVRRRSAWIVLAAVIVGLAAYAYLSTLPASYVAETTTVVARAPIEVDLGTNLRFRPEASVSFETYTTLALSRGVLEAVLPFHEREGVEALEGVLDLELIAGSEAEPATFLAVTHRVRSEDPAAAAASASAWVEATVATVRSLLLENLDAVEVITGDTLTLTRERLHAAEAALERFRAGAAPEALRARLEGMDAHVVELEHALLELERELTGRAAERDAFLRQRVGAGGTLGVVLMAAPEVVVELDGAIASLDASLAGLRVERDLMRQQLDDLDARRGAVAGAYADATVEYAALDRAAHEAQQSLEVLAAIDPNVAYVAQVAPSGVRVLSAATVPTEPEPSRALLIALLAGFVTAFAGVVMALVAEAVRAPEAAVVPATVRGPRRPARF
jgi:uncharacterized protein involved in exopolysaccharide biosynthesis